MNAQHRAAADSLVNEMLHDGVIERVSDDDTDGTFSPVFLVPKASDAGGVARFRFVFDGRRVNTFLRPQKHFRLTSLDEVRAMVSPGAFLATVDVASAYWHIPLESRERRHLRFRYGGKNWQFRSAPFGLATSGHIFVTVLRRVVDLLRRRSILVAVYADDLLIIGSSREQCERHLNLVLETLTMFGWTVNADKISPPSQTAKYLGVMINTKDMSMSLPPSKIKGARRDLDATIRAARLGQPIHLRTVARLLGVLSASNTALRGARTYAGPLQRALTLALRGGATWAGQMTMHTDSVVSLVELRTQLDALNGRPIIPLQHAAVTVATDASDTGGGWAVLAPPSMTHLRASIPFPPAMAKWHISQKEMITAIAATRAVVHHLGLTRTSVHLLVDNMAVKYGLAKGTSSNAVLGRMAEALHRYLLRRQVNLRVEWIASEQNSTADALSRRAQSSLAAATLTATATTKMTKWMQQYGLPPPSLDAFADEWNAQTARFASRTPSALAISSDGLLVDWSAENAVLAHPPPSMVPLVLNKLRDSSALVYLVLPHWTNRPYFNMLPRLAVAPPLLLPHHAVVVPHRPPDQTPLYSVWALCDRRSRREASPTSRPISSWTRALPRRSASTTRSGRILRLSPAREGSTPFFRPTSRSSTTRRARGASPTAASERYRQR